MKILQAHPAPVVPMALNNLWGSTFSRIEGGRAMARPLRRGLFNVVGLAVGEPLPAHAVSPQLLQARVRALMS
jgi:hypothetical protein